jgi:hypothetical protein
MINEISWGLEGIESWELRKDTNKVTEEAVRRIQEQQKKAQQIHQQIQQDQDQNNKFALFLSFLLKEIKNDSLIAYLYEVFFKVKHPKQQITYLRKTINTPLLVGIFAPFYPEKIEEYGLGNMYTALPKPFYVKDYIHYLKQLSPLYHDNIPIDKTSFLLFLLELLSNYGVLDKWLLSDLEKRQKQLLIIEKQLY